MKDVSGKIVELALRPVHATCPPTSRAYASLHNILEAAEVTHDGPIWFDSLSERRKNSTVALDADSYAQAKSHVPEISTNKWRCAICAEHMMRSQDIVYIPVY